MAGLRFSDIKIEIDIEKSVIGSPGKGQVTLYNLAPENQARIVALTKDRKPIPCHIWAGYGDAASLIFSGSTARVYAERDGVDRRLNVKLRGAIVKTDTGEGRTTNRSYDGAVGLQSIVEDLVSDLVGVETLKIGSLVEIPEVDLEDFAYQGDTIEGLTELLEGHGVSWFEDDGTIRFHQTGRHDADIPTVVLSPRTGLLGTPTVEMLGGTATSLLQPLAQVGGKVVVEAETLAGEWVASRVQHRGDNRTGPFTSEFTLRPLTEF